MGASIQSILVLLTKEFVLLIVVANLIAWPLIYFLMMDWLANFDTRIPISLAIFLISGCSALAVAIITIGLQSFQTASSNPVNALKHE